jgi:hypothetical protein
MMADGADLWGRNQRSKQLDADLVDAAAALGPGRRLLREEHSVEVGQGVPAGLLGPLGKVIVAEQRVAKASGC